MIYALDVQYNGDKNALVASVGFRNWDDKKLSYSKTHFIEKIEPYQSGLFYKRELPCLLEALSGLDDIDCVIIDGFVWLGEESRAGLGIYLYHALGASIPIIGVAKSPFSGTPQKCELLRGESLKPLFITSIGIDLKEAKDAIAKMSGVYRMPTFLKEVDSLARKFHNPPNGLRGFG
jgi:deoxyribonuclease V